MLKKYKNVLSLHRVDQLVRSAKNEMLYCLSEPEIRHITVAGFSEGGMMVSSFEIELFWGIWWEQ